MLVPKRTLPKTFSKENGNFMQKAELIELFKNAYLTTTTVMGGFVISDPFLNFTFEEVSNDNVVKQFYHLKNKKLTPYHMFIEILSVCLFGKSGQESENSDRFTDKLIWVMDKNLKDYKLTEETENKLSPDDAKAELELHKVLISAEELFYIFVLGFEEEPTEEDQNVACEIINNEECLEALSLTFQSWRTLILKK